MNYGSSAKAGPCLIMQILSFSVKFSSQQNFIFWNILLKNRIWVYLQIREQFSRKKGEVVVIPKYVCFTTFLSVAEATLESQIPKYVFFTTFLSVAEATLELQMSIWLSVSQKNLSGLRYIVYLISESSFPPLSASQNQLLSPWKSSHISQKHAIQSSSLSAFMSISHYANQPSYQSGTMPCSISFSVLFATFKPFIFILFSVAIATYQVPMSVC